MPATVYFTPALFKFLRDLKKNNSREWFQANRSRYEADVRNPLLDFIEDFAPHLAKLSPHFVASPRKTGGSMFRIHRDTRFSKDKTPYKTHAAAQFRHERARDAHVPAFYLHLEPGSVFAATGTWRPDSASAKMIRDAIAAKSTEWKRATGGKAIRAMCTFEGESLKRPPRGFDPEHPLINDLKRKDFLAVAAFSQGDACGADFLALFTRFCRAAGPYTAFLTKALNLKY